MCRRHTFTTSPFNRIGAEVHGGGQVHSLVAVHPVRIWKRFVGVGRLPDSLLPAYPVSDVEGEFVQGHVKSAV